MSRKSVRFIFNDSAQYDAPAPSKGLVFAIRTDARHATQGLKRNIVNHLMTRPGHSLTAPETEQAVERAVHGFYKIWGHDVLRALARDLNYDLYNIPEQKNRFLQVHFYDAHELAGDTLQKAAGLAATIQTKTPPVFVSLDSMIKGEGENHTQVGFSRVFSVAGDSQSGYIARPGAKPLTEQLDALAARFDNLHAQYGGPVPFVLLEDNVRHARMLNWFIDQMEDRGVFAHAKLAGIATSFCCAPEGERNAIRHKGETIPLAISVDYKDEKVDVTTPRDFLFDGLVIQAGDKTARLPGIFMDAAKMFKINPDRTAQFSKAVQRSNLEFCRNLQQEFGVTLPLAWFEGAGAISHVTGYAPETPMETVLRDSTRRAPQP